MEIPKAVQSCHDLLLWMIPQIDKFPRQRRFTLGERLEKYLLDVLENLLAAAWSKNKQTPLSLANQKLDASRHLWRLSFELKAVSMKQYKYGSQCMVELGKQIGGWRKQA